jgi:endonuclease YncB( thermonuclease family)
LVTIAIAVAALPEVLGYLGVMLYGATGCSVTRVIDGDTVHAFCPGRGFIKVRLLGYDTPEVYSPKCPSEWWAGTKATWALRKRLWTAGEVSLVLSGSDRYGRRLGTLFVDGRNISRTMIDAGHARAYGGGRRKGWCW